MRGGLLSYRSRVFVLHEKTIIIITFKGKLYKINSGGKKKDCWDYTGMFDFLCPRKGGKKEKEIRVCESLPGLACADLSKAYLRLRVGQKPRSDCTAHWSKVNI